MSETPATVAVTGASGFLGQAVVRALAAAGHRTIGVSRDPSRLVAGCSEMRAFPSGPDRAAFAGCAAVIHLAGEPIVGLWTRKKMRRIRESRVVGTRRVVEAMRAASPIPAALVSASGVGYYGDTGERETDEAAPAGEGFLSEVARDWENEAVRAEECGIRVVRLRIAMVLGPGGAMRLLGPVFRAGLGGPLGSGCQWMAWIHVEDVAAMAVRALDDGWTGPYNACAPGPVRNADFAAALAAAVRRPAIFRAPAFALRAVLRGFSAELLENRRVIPARASDAGFRFRYPNLPAALAASVREDR